MHAKTIARIAKPLKQALGAHKRLRYEDCPATFHDEWERLRLLSEDAERQLRYLVSRLQNRSDAALLARFCRAPGYINFR